MPISMPMPTNLPPVLSRNSRKLFLSKYWLCGSSPATMPPMASEISFFSSTGLDIVALDHAEHRGQLLQLFQRQRRQRIAGVGLQLHGGQRPGHGTHGQQPGNSQFGTHRRRASSKWTSRPV